MVEMALPVGGDPRSSTDDLRKFLRWLLWLAFVPTVPALFTDFVVSAGFVPVPVGLHAYLSMPISARGGSAVVALQAVIVVEGLAYCGLYYVTARALGGALARVRRATVRRVLVGVIVVSLAGMTFLPIYVPVHGDGEGEPRNLIRLLGLRKSLAGTPFALRPTLQDLAEDRNVAVMKEWLVTHALERAYESQTSWEYAAQRGYVDVLSRQWAALKGQIPTNVNARALVAAIRYSRADAVTFLLAHGADPNWSSGCFGGAVVEAARTPAMLRLLIEHDADPRRANCVGTTTLMLAAQRGNEADVRLLLNSGVDPNARDTLGRTALIYAAEGSKDAVDVVSLLVAAGADVNARDTTGTTPLRAAKNWRHPQAYASLQAAGAQE